MNLLQNAQQAIEYGGTGSTIGVRTGFADSSRVTLEVWDDGPGIPGVIQARIFDPFFTTKPPGVGTGLGLAIVLGFVRQHGGTVSLLNPPHGGARFVVELPVPPAAGIHDDEKCAASAAGELPPPARPIRPRRSAGRKVPRILVVEDEPTVASLIADVLGDEGMHVDVLLDSREAVQQAQRESYDLAVCNCLEMPGVDGQTFYLTLVQQQNPLRERVLFVTGDIVAPRTQEFLDRHHLAHVAKPFRMEELTVAVHRDVGKEKGAGGRPGKRQGKGSLGGWVTRWGKQDHGEREEFVMVCGEREFREEVQGEWGRRHDTARLQCVSGWQSARKLLEARIPAVILVEQLTVLPDARAGREKLPALNAVVTLFAGYAPTVVVGSAEQQAGLLALLAGGTVDFVTRAAGCLSVAMWLVDAPLRRHSEWRNARMARPLKTEDHPGESKPGISGKFCATN